MSKIQWTEKTWNPVVGCLKVSKGCDNCYAIQMSNRLEGMGQDKYTGLVKKMANGDLNWNGVVRTDSGSLELPLRWKKPRLIFVNSMSDLFHKDVPDDFIEDVFTAMALTPRHTYQILTKRPENMLKFLSGEKLQINIVNKMISRSMDAEETGEDWRDGYYGELMYQDPKDWKFPLSNVWLGTSTEDQKTADERIPILLQTPAAVRWISAEPLLGEIDLTQVGIPNDLRGIGIQNYNSLITTNKLNWLVVGGESGHGARECKLEWIEKIVEDCKNANVPVFVKQLGSVLAKKMNLKSYKGGDINEFPEHLRIREYPIH